MTAPKFKNLTLTAKWGQWSAWKYYDRTRERRRELFVGGIEIAYLREVFTRPDHLFGEGHFWLLRIGREQTVPAHRSLTAALRRLHVKVVG